MLDTDKSLCVCILIRRVDKMYENHLPMAIEMAGATLLE